VVTLFEVGAFMIICKHIQRKGNRWYYRRRIPNFARNLHYGGKTNKERTEIYFSLKTVELNEAARLADIETRKLDALWKAAANNDQHSVNPLLSIATLEQAGLAPGDGERHPEADAIDDFRDRLLGMREPGDPPARVSAQNRLTLDILYGKPIPRTLEDARRKHFELGKGPSNNIAEGQFNRAWSLLLRITGDITLEHLRREHANEFVRRLIRQGVGPETVKRYLSQVRPVVKTGIQEFELQLSNPFEGVIIPNKGEPKRKPRDVYTMEELDAIHKKCREVNDERRWAIAMLSDTGARVAEIAGLRKEDVFLDHAVPHIRLTGC